jgi:hypothetical protein
MSQQYDNRNTVSLFKNSKKESDKHPDYTGTLNVDGEEFYVDAWLNTIKQGQRAGEKFISGKIKPKNGGGGGNQGNRRNDDFP